MKTLPEQLACAKREVAMRKTVYFRRIAQGLMNAEIANHEIECMEEIVRTLEKLQPQKELI